LSSSVNPPVWLVRFTARAHLVEAALKYTGGTHSVADIAAGIESGAYQMWTSPNAIGITEVVQHPQLKECNLFLAAGDAGEMEQVLPHIEEWAKKQGCDRMIMVGRKGWLRSFLTKREYRPRWYAMTKDLGKSEGARADGE